MQACHLHVLGTYDGARLPVGEIACAMTLKRQYLVDHGLDFAVLQQLSHMMLQKVADAYGSEPAYTLHI